MSKTIKILILTLLVAAVVGLSFGAGCVLRTSVPTGSEQGLEIIGQAWNIILRDYVAKDELDISALTEGAINGMLEVLDDPYTVYMDPETYQLGLTGLEGRFEGIGATISVKDGQLVVIAPIADTPAAEAGIKAGDIILEIEFKFFN